MTTPSPDYPRTVPLTTPPQTTPPQTTPTNPATVLPTTPKTATNKTAFFNRTGKHIEFAETQLKLIHIIRGEPLTMSIIKSHDVTLTKDIGQYHIELVPMTNSHLPILYKWNKKSDVLYWCEGDDVVTNEPEDVDGIYGSISEKAYMFIIIVNAQPIGDCWLQDLNLPELQKNHLQKNVKRIDITIYDNSFWNAGIGVLINSMLLEFGFIKCDVDMIYAITEDYNLRAQKCLLKSGFALDMILEHSKTSKGKSEYCYLINKQKYISSNTK